MKPEWSRYLFLNVDEIDSLEAHDVSKDDFAKAVLGQGFSYLAEGAQSVVFESFDKEHVLKIPKTAEGILIKFLEWKELLAPRAAKKIFAKGLRNFEMAYKDLRDESVMEYLHFRRTNGLGGICLENLKIDADSIPFMIQEKVTPIQDVLNKLMSERREKSAQDVLQDWVFFQIGLWQKGFCDTVCNFTINSGITNEGRVVLIDTGEMSTDREKIKRLVLEKRVLSMYSFKWLRCNYPGLADFFEEKVGENFILENIPC